MTVVPRYNLPIGSEVRLRGSDLAITGMTGDGYVFYELETGASVSVPFAAFVDYMKLPGAKIDAALPQTGSRLQGRLGGLRTSENLPDHQLEKGRFHLSLCQAMVLLRNKLREDTRNPSLELSINMLNRDVNRCFVRDVAQRLCGEPIKLGAPRGGKSTNWWLYKGRTLRKFLVEFDSLHPEESPLDALTPLDHLKGNRVPRIDTRIKELMTKAWEEIGLDTRESAVADVMRRLEVLIGEENGLRKRNDLPQSMCPSHSALVEHRNYLLKPTEYMIGTKGERHTRNKRGRGSTDLRALLVGEYIEVDECHASLVVSAKIHGQWEGMSPDFRGKIEEIDKEIRERLTILVAIDVATRMPLAWVISEAPKAEATIALLRMATRDKTMEKVKYGCSGEPVQAIGIGNVKIDNGTGLRNVKCTSALVGIGATSTIVRAFNSSDKTFIERMFGTTESVLLRLVHGYTGRKPGDLPGYDATENGVLDIDELYGILTRFMIDVYPSMPHMGFGMGGRRPFEVYKELAETRGCIPQIDPNIRRIHLGWERKVTPSDEGVRVFSGIWFNSDALQVAVDDWKVQGQKLSVFVDPEDMNRATVLVPGVMEPIEVELQSTAFASLTLVEILDLMAQWRRENPKVTELHEDRLIRFRKDFYQQMKTIGVERKLPRSFSTVEECMAKAKAVFAGARIIPGRGLDGMTHPENITRTDLDEDVFQIGGGDSLIEGTLGELDAGDDGAVSEHPLALDDIDQPSPKPRKARSGKDKTDIRPLGRPKNIKELE